jgi:L-ascorbate metabolism protein UlaG (beta-lactamase superfamily)
MKKNEIRITYLSNAGFMLTDGYTKILIDAVHTEQALNFSPIPEKIMNKIINGEGDFSNIDFLIFTHVHKDHCDLKKLCEVQNPETKIILPELDENNKIYMKDDLDLLPNPISYLNSGYGEVTVIEAGNIKIKAARTYHDGIKYHNTVNHFSYLISVADQQILFMGDAESGNSNITDWLGNETIDTVCINFTEISQEIGRAFISEVVNPQLAISCHIPLQQHDKFHYRERAMENVSKYSDSLPKVYVCLETMETIKI